MILGQEELRELSNEATAHVLRMEGTQSGTRTGWLMITTILIEAWDLYSISFLLIFIKDDFKPSAALLGLASAAVQLGALIGSMMGGWAADRLGRRKVFLTTMASFVVLAILQAFATSMWQLVFIRFLLGIPLGSDIATGYTYIMESMPKGKREVMGNRWQGMFGLGEVTCIIVVTIMYLSGMNHSLLWRIGLGLGALPALILLIMRLDVPETALSLIQAGRFKQAKKVAKEMFNDTLDMLPDEDYRIRRPRTRDFLADIWKDPVRRRASIFAWISNAMQGIEFSAFGFYLPVILILSGVSGLAGTNFFTAAIYTIATISGFVAPIVTPKLGHRGISQWGFGGGCVSLLAAALFLSLGWRLLVPVAAAAMMWCHYWSASNGMTICSMVAPSRYKATASGFGYMFVKLPNFLTIFLFPVVFEQLGIPLATALVSLSSLTGFLAARFILPEVYGYIEHEKAETASRV
ncbi:MAG TPA: MFS transporter [Chthoniobacterales bacterium]|jgi:MFS family permease|nr:MFS transporter [Chthoniobacterales bacterium]